MSNNAYKASSRTRRYGLLSKVSLSELKTIRIAVRRSNITVQGPPTPIVRSIDDPKQLVPLVHIKTGNEISSTSIFDRPDIQVNQEERLILADANRLEPNFSPTSESSTRSRSRTPVRRSKISTANERSNNSPRTRSIERRSRSCEKRSKSRDRRSRSPEKRSKERQSTSNEKRSMSRGKRSRSRDRRSRSKEKRERSREISRSREGRSDEKYRRNVKEKDSSYRPRRQSSQEKIGKGRSVDRLKGKDRPLERLSFSRERSRDRDKSKERFKPKRKSTERDTVFSSRRSPTTLRPGEYRPGHPDLKTRSRSRGRSDRIRSVSRRSKSPSRDRYQSSSSSRISRSPRYERPSTRRTSHSPRRSRSPSGYPGKRTRDRSGEKRRSRSPMRKGERNRSGSPHSSPSKHPRRGSRSPGRTRGRYRPPADLRSSRSRSPHPPVVTFDRPAAARRRRSRTPDRDRRRHGRRSGSRSPVRRGDGYDAGAVAPPIDFGYYEGVPGADFWIPTPLRPGFPAMPRFYPPAYFPRGFPPGAPIIFRPRYPMMCPPNLHRPMYHRNRIRPATETSTSIGVESAVAKVPAVTTGEVTVQEVVESKKMEDKDKEIAMSDGK